MKLSDLSDEQWFLRLSARRDSKRTAIRGWWEYYDGNQPLYFLLRILEEQDNRFAPLTINWAQKFIDSVDRRMFVEGFTLGGQDKPDDDLWATWNRNDMSEFQSENNINSLVTDDSYIMVGPDDDSKAVITVENPASLSIEIEPKTRRTIAGLHFYQSDEESTRDDRATLWIPDGTTGGVRLVEFENGKAVGSTKQGWMKGASKLQSSPSVPIVSFPNRQRQRRGRSELEAIKPIIDAANFTATSMMATILHHAMPRMLAINVAESMFLNDDGSVNREAVKSATGALWVVPAQTDEDGNMPENPAEVDIKQLPASDMRNFHETLSVLARLGAGLCDLPPHSLGFDVSDNPASADGIRASENDMVARVERLQIARGNGYERVMRLAMAVEGKDPAKAVGLETVWRSAATPTEAAKAASAVAMYGNGNGLADKRQARVDYGYSLTTIQAMEKREAEAQSDPKLMDAVNALNAAKQASIEAANRGNAPVVS